MIARLLISSSKDRLKEEITEILRLNLSGYRTNHLDLLYIQAGEKLGIAEARRIKNHFSLKPYSAKGKAVVLEDASVMTVEAQNALLKTLEELPAEALLILGTSSEANFLPTVLSRCQIIHLQDTNPAGDTHPTPGVGKEDIEKLISSSVEERFAFIEKLKNKEEFLKVLIRYFNQDVAKNKNLLMKLLQAEEWAKQNVNIRAILEYLMLEMPSDRSTK